VETRQQDPIRKDGTEDVANSHTALYKKEYARSFVEKWDTLIDWDKRARGEGAFFIKTLEERGVTRILDVATGTGFHSVQLLKHGFDVTSVDGSPEMLGQAFQNAKDHGFVLKTVCSDWRWLGKDVAGLYDAVICLGNSFTHIFDEADRRKVLAEFYSVLAHDGVLILDQRNYDAILDRGYSSRHQYYYCGSDVVVEPVEMDGQCVRFEYRFADGDTHHLNLFPLRKDYTRRLLTEAGFTDVTTYGDFQETYRETEPDFFIHLAEKVYSEA